MDEGIPGLGTTATEGTSVDTIPSLVQPAAETKEEDAQAQAQPSSPAKAEEPEAEETKESVKRPAEEEADGERTVKAPRRGENDPPLELDEVVSAKLADLIDRGLVLEGELDPSCLGELADFPAEKGVEALAHFETSKLDEINNKAGFLAGIMTRLRRQGPPRQHPDVQKKLDGLFRLRKMRANDLDQRCYDVMHDSPAPLALACLDRFSARELKDVRNLSAFFMSKFREAEKDLSAPLARPSRDYDSGYGASRPSYAERSQSRYTQNEPSSRGPARGYSAQALPPHRDAYGASRSGPVPMYNASSQQPGPGGRPHTGRDQALAGVRVEEFQGLADVACCVPAPVALKLQTLWDDGNKLVSMLDDRSWEAMADLPAPEGLAAVAEVASAMDRPPGLRNANAYLMSVAGKMLTSLGARPPARGGGRGGSPPPSGGRDMGRGGYDGGSRNGGGAGGDGGSYRGPSRDARGVGALNALPPGVANRAQGAIAQSKGFLKEHHFDEGIVEQLNYLGESQSLKVLDEVLSNDLATVRSMPAYIMGICKRYKGRAAGGRQ